jgi:hypothetical protein
MNENDQQDDPQYRGSALGVSNAMRTLRSLSMGGAVALGGMVVVAGGDEAGAARSSASGLKAGTPTSAVRARLNPPEQADDSKATQSKKKLSLDVRAVTRTLARGVDAAPLPKPRPFPRPGTCPPLKPISSFAHNQA